MSRFGDGAVGFATGALQGIDDQKRQKQQLLLELMKAGVYQPATTPQNQPPQSLLSKIGANIMGPDLNSPNPSLMGMPLQRVQTMSPSDVEAKYGKNVSASYGPGGQLTSVTTKPTRSLEDILTETTAKAEAGAIGRTRGTEVTDKEQTQRILSLKPTDPEYQIINDYANGKMTFQNFRQQFAGLGNQGRAALRGAYALAKKINPYFNPVAIETEIYGSRAALGNLNRLKSITSSFERTASKNLDLAMQYSGKVGRGKYPWLNKISMDMSTKLIQDPRTAPDVKAFLNTVTTAVSEYTKVASGSMGVAASTDAARLHFKNLLAAVDSPQVFAKEVSIMKQEMGNRMQGFQEEGNQILSDVQNVGQAGNPVQSQDNSNMSDDDAYAQYLQATGGK